ncbi:serine hydrolase domain-containing protein [Stenotrophomonas sp.]|uniref:serine hydrolase domain-containing protein n=1 Tax=Stenotrophomonas sp. TaxID=69392 RepID=UPI0028A0217E|nr:serine hydrolase domain-containing protein [Stenotrophomonas sp.]
MTAILLGLTACTTVDRPNTTPNRAAAPAVTIPDPEATARLDAILREHRIITAGFGVIRSGELVWSHYAGEESPGVTASAQTRFNVASLTKPVVAETVMRLAYNGKIDLDEPLSYYWVDPDVAHDPRRHALTARQVLNHTSGFPNWRFFRADRKLTFEHAPGTHYGYSGEGFEYLARAAANKLKTPFPDLVQKTVFAPIGMQDSAIEVDRSQLQHVARPQDDSGTSHAVYCRPEGWCRPNGSYSAADDLLTTVRDYARFLADVHRGTGYSATIARERDHIYTDRGSERMIDCGNADVHLPCPQKQGFGLGFEIADFGSYQVMGHTGSDWAEQSVAYLYRPSGDGVIVFLNAPFVSTVQAMPELLGVIDPASPFLPRYLAQRDPP